MYRRKEWAVGRVQDDEKVHGAWVEEDAFWGSASVIVIRIRMFCAANQSFSLFARCFYQQTPESQTPPMRPVPESEPITAGR